MILGLNFNDSTFFERQFINALRFKVMESSDSLFGGLNKVGREQAFGASFGVLANPPFVERFFN